MDGVLPVPGVKLGDELRKEMCILQRVLDGGQARARSFALPRAGLTGADEAIGVLATGAVDLAQGLLFQQAQKHVAQSIGAQSAEFEGAVGADEWVGLEKLGDLAEDGAIDAVDGEVLEQEQRFERRVGGEAQRHPQTEQTAPRQRPWRRRRSQVVVLGSRQGVWGLQERAKHRRTRAGDGSRAWRRRELME